LKFRWINAPLHPGDSLMTELDKVYMQTDCLERNQLADALSALVSVNTVNPSCGGPADGEAAGIHWIADHLAGAGLKPQIHEAMPGRPNLITCLEGGNPDKCLLFQTHVDTVSATGMKIDPFGGKVIGNRLLGRGATDAKGQVIAMAHALMAWSSSGVKPPVSICLAVCVDEEFSFGGARALLRDGIRAEGIIIGEPTDLHLVVTHKGVVRTAIHFEGISAHAALPDLGVNAIEAAGSFIEEMRTWYFPQLRKRATSLLSPPTVNIGLIEGGVQPNLVAPSCEILLERRLLPHETPEQYEQELNSVLDRTSARFPSLNARVEPHMLSVPAFSSPVDSWLVELAGGVLADMGRDRQPMGVDYATDASVLSASGLPIIIIGPGNIQQAHTADEYIDLDDLAAGSQFYAELMGRGMPV
jgi:succinyl-diaminopimelate desuccinylase